MGHWKSSIRRVLSNASGCTGEDIVTVLTNFSSEYLNSHTNPEHRRQMINSTEFIQLLSLSVKEIRSFSPDELCHLVHLTTVSLEWRDQTLLRLLEPTFMTSLPDFDATNVIRLIESYSKLRCGSRPLWESLISSLLSYLDGNKSASYADALRLIRCIAADESKFYKPLLVLEKLYPLIDDRLLSGETIPLSELSDIVSVYSRWTKSVGSRADLNTFIDKCLIATRETELASDFPSVVAILSAIHRLSSKSPSEPTVDFLTRAMNATETSHVVIQNLNASELVSFIQSISRFPQLLDNRKELFTNLHDSLLPLVYQISPSKLPLIAQIFSKFFGLVNTYKFSPVNFGPVREGHMIPPLITDIAGRCVKDGTMARMSVRQLARLGEAMANVRLNNLEFWASFSTVLNGVSDIAASFGELSPEELGQLAFTFAEMNLGVSEDVRNSMVMLIFEKIHLMGNFFNELMFFFTICFDEENSMKLMSQLIELADMDSLMSDGSMVLGNMVLRKIGDLGGSVGDFCNASDEDVIAFWKNARSVMNPGIIGSMNDGFEREIGDTVKVDVEMNNIAVDIFVPSRNLVVLVCSPLQLVGETIPTGTAILRYQATVSSLPNHVAVANMSSVEWANASAERREEIIRDVLRTESVACQDGPRENGEVAEEDLPDMDTDFVNPDEDDLSPFIQKDRSAAHRRRAPPNTSLPWVPSVFSLKRKPRASRRRNTS